MTKLLPVLFFLDISFIKYINININCNYLQLDKKLFNKVKKQKKKLTKLINKKPLNSNQKLKKKKNDVIGSTQ